MFLSEHQESRCAAAHTFLVLHRSNFTFCFGNNSGRIHNKSKKIAPYLAWILSFWRILIYWLPIITKSSGTSTCKHCTATTLNIIINSSCDSIVLTYYYIILLYGLVVCWSYFVGLSRLGSFCAIENFFLHYLHFMKLSQWVLLGGKTSYHLENIRTT
jgi:hypothetical protein